MAQGQIKITIDPGMSVIAFEWVGGGLEGNANGMTFWGFHPDRARLVAQQFTEVYGSAVEVVEVEPGSFAL